MRGVRRANAWTEDEPVLDAILDANVLFPRVLRDTLSMPLLPASTFPGGAVTCLRSFGGISSDIGG